jgi:hypothetical protein
MVPPGQCMITHLCPELAQMFSSTLLAKELTGADACSGLLSSPTCERHQSRRTGMLQCVRPYLPLELLTETTARTKALSQQFLASEEALPMTRKAKADESRPKFDEYLAVNRGPE